MGLLAHLLEQKTLTALPEATLVEKRTALKNRAWPMTASVTLTPVAPAEAQLLDGTS